MCQVIQNAFAQQHLGHAYLLHGPRGVGKTTVARIMSRLVNCTQVREGEPCNQCQACQEMLAGSAMDVMEIDAASHRGIQYIRELRENCQFQPMKMNKKVYVIDEAHMLTMESFNALLKTLEEPPPHILFVLVTTELRKIPLTILSRCQTLTLKAIEMAALAQYLESLCKKLQSKYEQAAILAIARQAKGSIRDMLSLFEQVYYFSGGNIRLAEVEQLLGLIPEELTFAFVAEIYSAGAHARQAEAADFPAMRKLIQHMRSHDPQEGFVGLLAQVLSIFRMLTYLKRDISAHDYLNLTREQAHHYQQTFAEVYAEQLQLGYRHFYGLWERYQALPLANHLEFSVLLEMESLHLMEKLSRPTLAKILSDWVTVSASDTQRKLQPDEDILQAGKAMREGSGQSVLQPSMAHELQKAFQGTIVSGQERSIAQDVEAAESNSTAGESR